MDEAIAAEAFALILRRLAASIDYCNLAAARARSFKVYALCRQQEAARKRILRALAPGKGAAGLPFVTALRFHWHNFAMVLRLRRCRERAAIAQLRVEDRQLRAEVEDYLIMSMSLTAERRALGDLLCLLMQSEGEFARILLPRGHVPAWAGAAAS